MKDDLQAGYENVNTLKSGKFQSESRYPKSRQMTLSYRTKFYKNQTRCSSLVNKLQRVHTVCLSSAKALSVFLKNVPGKESQALHLKIKLHRVPENCHIKIIFSLREKLHFQITGSL